MELHMDCLRVSLNDSKLWGEHSCCSNTAYTFERTALLPWRLLCTDGPASAAYAPLSSNTILTNTHFRFNPIKSLQRPLSTAENDCLVVPPNDLHRWGGHGNIAIKISNTKSACASVNNDSKSLQRKVIPLRTAGQFVGQDMAKAQEEGQMLVIGAQQNVCVCA